jgi:hypothetical protein
MHGGADMARTQTNASFSLPELWNRCLEEEKRIRAMDLAVLQGEFEDDLAFGPLLVEPRNINAGPHRVVADNYRHLLKMLREALTPEEKWRILAMWLRQEGICQPREFLPKKVRKKLVAETRGILEAKGRKLSVKPAELLYALTAGAWKPYFERMCAAYASLPKQRRGVSEALIKLGFDQQAVDAALQATGGLTTADKAACLFAADHLKVDENSVLVAQSKLFPKKRRKS